MRSTHRLPVLFVALALAGPVRAWQSVNPDIGPTETPVWRAEAAPDVSEAIAAAIGRCAGQEGEFVAAHRQFASQRYTLDERARGIAKRKADIDAARTALEQAQAALADDVRRAHEKESELAAFRHRIEKARGAKKKDDTATQRLYHAIEAYNRDIADHNQSVRELERRKAEVAARVTAFNEEVLASNEEIEAFDADATDFVGRWNQFAATVDQSRQFCGEGREVPDQEFAEPEH